MFSRLELGPVLGVWDPCDRRCAPWSILTRSWSVLNSCVAGNWDRSQLCSQVPESVFSCVAGGSAGKPSLGWGVARHLTILTRAILISAELGVVLGCSDPFNRSCAPRHQDMCCCWAGGQGVPVVWGWWGGFPQPDNPHQSCIEGAEAGRVS